MTLQQFKDNLVSFVNGRYRVSHYFFIKEPYPYLRWAEIEQDPKMHGNNKPRFLPWVIVLDYFTQMEFDPEPDNLIDFLCSLPCTTFRSRTVASTTDTGLILHEITIEVG